MLLGALRALTGDAWVKEHCKKTTKDIVIQELPQFLESGHGKGILTTMDLKHQNEGELNH